MNKAECLVVYEQSEDGWGAYAPDLPGLGVVGDSWKRFANSSPKVSGCTCRV
jgi:hypothetical protein